MTPEAVESRPVVVLPLWRRTEQCEDVDRPGVLRGHSGPVAPDQAEPVGEEG